ncbi:MAG: hypothetical protein ACE5GX_06470 [Thermoanaerobaculia bacterium]
MRQYKTDGRKRALALLLAAACSYPATSRAEISIGVNNVLQVAAPGPTVSDNCQSLLDALATITDSSSSNRYVVRLEPGTYTCSTSIVVPEGVTLQGMAGRQYTKIYGTVDSSLLGVVHLQSFTGLANVWVRNFGDNKGSGGIAVSVWSFSPLVQGVRLSNVWLQGAPSPPNNHSLLALGSLVGVHSSLFTQLAYLDLGGSVRFHYSRVNGVSVNGGSDARCFFSDKSNWQELNQVCGP